MSKESELRECLEKWLAQSKCEDDPALLAETARVLGHETKPAPSVRECLEAFVAWGSCIYADPMQALEDAPPLLQRAKVALAAPVERTWTAEQIRAAFVSFIRADHIIFAEPFIRHLRGECGGVK